MSSQAFRRIAAALVISTAAAGAAFAPSNAMAFGGHGGFGGGGHFGGGHFGGGHFGGGWGHHGGWGGGYTPVYYGGCTVRSFVNAFGEVYYRKVCY